MCVSVVEAVEGASYCRDQGSPGQLLERLWAVEVGWETHLCACISTWKTMGESTSAYSAAYCITAYCTCKSEHRQLEWGCGFGGDMPRCEQLRRLGSRSSYCEDCLSPAAGGIHVIYMYVFSLLDLHPDQPHKGTG